MFLLMLFNAQFYGHLPDPITEPPYEEHPILTIIKLIAFCAVVISSVILISAAIRAHKDSKQKKTDNNDIQ